MSLHARRPRGGQGRHSRLLVLLTNTTKARIPGAWLRRLARMVMEAEGCADGTELSVAIGDDRWIQELNQEYKSRQAPTDVLAFPQAPSVPQAAGLLGDVAISVETARRQAREAGHELRAELALLLTHGILHLTGWRDTTPTQRRRMMVRARELLKRFAREPGP